MMTARWRTVLQVRALVRLLLERHVPLGTFGDLVEQISKMSDEALVESEARIPSLTAGLARQLVEAMLGEQTELIDRDVKPFEVWLSQRPFFDLMQAYRHHPVEDLAGTADAFQAVKAALREAARQ